MANEQRIVHFAGDVQGVGFRFTAIRVAERYDVTGYVQNLPDGRVKCVVEGRPEQIDAFVAELSEQMRDYIRRTTQQSAPASGAWQGFGLKF